MTFTLRCAEPTTERCQVSCKQYRDGGTECAPVAAGPGARAALDALTPLGEAFSGHEANGFSGDRARPRLCHCGEKFATDTDRCNHAGTEVARVAAEQAGSFVFTDRIDAVLAETEQSR